MKKIDEEQPFTPDIEHDDDIELMYSCISCEKLIEYPGECEECMSKKLRYPNNEHIDMEHDDFTPDEEQDFEPDEMEFIRCSECDGHDACEDFGCAVDLGLGHLLSNNLPF